MLGISVTLTETVFEYLCICIYVFAHQILGNIIFEVLVPSPLQKGNVNMVLESAKQDSQFQVMEPNLGTSYHNTQYSKYFKFSVMAPKLGIPNRPQQKKSKYISCIKKFQI